MDTIDPQAAPAPAAPAATEAMLDDEDDDASGPSILLRAAAEMIVDEAERDSHIDAAEALLRLIPTVDLETMYDFLSPCSWSGASRRHSLVPPLSQRESRDASTHIISESGLLVLGLANCKAPRTNPFYVSWAFVTAIEIAISE